MTLQQPRRRCRRGGGGFTLVEVLASLVIMGIVLPFAMRGASLAMHAGSVARHQAEAATLGEAKLTEMVSMGSWADSGAGGDFGQDFPQYRWTLDNTQRDIGVTELMLSVIWQERGEDRSVKLSTFVYIPTGNASTGATQ
jgi:prepilin-type N-terminal cleavage/methylation domain-containing protein